MPSKRNPEKTRDASNYRPCTIQECPFGDQADNVQAMLECSQCFKWYHADCLTRLANTAGLTTRLQGQTSSELFSFICPNCEPDGPHLIQRLADANLLSEGERHAFSIFLTSQNDLQTTSEISGSGDQRKTPTTPSQLPTTSRSQPSSTEPPDQTALILQMMQMMREERQEDQRRQETQRREDREEDHRRQIAAAEQQQQFILQLLDRQPTQGANTQVDPTTSNSVHPYLKLNKLETPKFDGEDLALWPAYWAQFNSAIHSNDKLGPSEKMHYLINGLSGRALNVVKGYTIQDNNYQPALNVLKARFGQEKDIIHRLYSTINKLPRVQTNKGNLEFITDQVANVLLAWKNLEKDTDVFYPAVYSKLSLPLLEIFDNLQNNENESDMDRLAKFLQNQTNQQIRHQDVSAVSTFSTPVKYVKQPQLKNSMPSLVSSSTQPVNKSRHQGCFSEPHPRSQQSVPLTLTCAFCGVKGQHWSCNCSTTTDQKQRQELLRQGNRCFRCLKVMGPNHRQECRAKPCRHCGGKNHHVAICWKSSVASTNAAILTVPPAGTNSQTLLSSCVGNSNISSMTASPQIFMMITHGFIGKAKGKESHKVIILIDSGSKSSFIRSSLAEDIGCQNLSEPSPLAIAHFGSAKLEKQTSRRVGFSLKTIMGSSLQLATSTIDSITTPLSSGPLQLPATILAQLQGRQLANYASDRPDSFIIDVIIGADYFNKIVVSSSHLTPNLTLNHTVLGLLLFGGIGDTNLLSQTTAITTTVLLAPNESSEDVLGKMWELEHIGILDEPHIADDDMAIDQFNSTVQKIDNRYSVHWPWRQLTEPLPHNYNLARDRLRRFQKSQLLQKPQLLEKYDKLIQDQLNAGIIEKVPHHEVMNPNYAVHYIPHHAVIKEASNTTKLRIVYDASAKTAKGTSLNQHLLRGPVILANLVGLLLRFRLWNFVTISDIEKAFLQVALAPSQRDVCRFIWFKDPKKPHCKENQQIYRFCRVPFGMISSPFLLGATIQHHLNLEGSYLATCLKDNIYVDNIIYGEDTEEALLNYYHKAKQLFNSASMNLREWTSNSNQLQDHLPDSDKGPTKKVKVLGIEWEPVQDTINITGSMGKLPTQFTKRTLLHSVAAIFDPLGLLSPVVLAAKKLLQELWAKNLDWDDPIPSDMINVWTAAFKNLQDVAKFSQPRHLLPSPIVQPELVCFVDASSTAYGAVIYIKDRNNYALLCSKARIAPLKQMTIPRLELLAVLIGTRLLAFIQKQLKYDFKSIHLFSDSQIVLMWLTSSLRRTVFVENRLTEIRANNNIVFHYIDTKENPADLTTRGCTLNELVNSSKWAGPQWIKEKSSTWKVWETVGQEYSEVRKNQSEMENIDVGFCLTTEDLKQNNNPFDLNPSNFSSFHRLLTRTALLLRAIHNFKNPTSRRRPPPDVIEPMEIQQARHLWEKRVQQEAFKDLVSKDTLSLKQTDLVQSLRLFLDEEGLIRSQGRLGNSDLTEDTNCPILLPKNHPVTQLIILDKHIETLHSGPNQVLAHLRQRYWITSGRSQVSRTLKHCQRCRQMTGNAFCPPPLPDLPASRVTQAPAFSHIGTDLAGPFRLKDESNCYLYIFVCMASRAVHFELVPDKSTEQFLLAFTRFAGRRGVPKSIYSDNGTQFRMTKRKLHSTDNHTGFLSNPPTWHFIPPASPWMGGFYERLIGTFRRALLVNLGRSKLNWYQMSTIMVEIEGIMNSQPLTYVGADISNGHILTPADLISPTSRLFASSDYPKRPQTLSSDTPINIVQLWEYSKRRLQGFWEKWKTEYLLQLRDYNLRIPHQLRNNVKRQPKIGEVVVVRDLTQPRGFWRIAQIQTLCYGKDGHVRSVLMKDAKGRQIHRPVREVFPMELNPGGECQQDVEKK